MSVLSGTATVFRFEMKRSRKFKRFIWWILLTGFPPALMLLVVATAGRPPNEDPVPLVTYILCPCVVCVLGVFLWATPWLSSELEGRSWVYPAVRPGGAWSVMLGKYFAAVAWTIPAGMISSMLCVLIIASEDQASMISVQWRLVVLSCFAYAALFTLIGTIAPKRSMVVGIFFTLIFEVVLSWVPAAVNLLTIQFRLRCLLVRWLDWDVSKVDDDNPMFLAYFGESSAPWHLAVLVCMTLAMLGAAAYLVKFREFTAEAETDV